MIFIILLVSANLQAEWSYVGKTVDGETTTYVDYQSIHKKGSKAKIWALFDYKTVDNINNVIDGKPYLSMVRHAEFDCINETLRMLDYYAYSGNMKIGRVVNYESNTKYDAISIVPGSLDDVTFNIICNKKK